MLYLIATPIGHLGDFSARACATIDQCAYLLCEDTRHTQILLRHYSLKAPLKSYHRFNERAKLEPILTDLKQGIKVGLITDAGTPAINDPGERLVAACRELAIPVTLVPGACALIFALACSGYSTERFQFLGFTPKKKGALLKVLAEALAYPGTSIFYESPYRILPTLKALASIAPDQQLCIARELSKTFEEFLYGTAAELALRVEKVPLKGECVLLLPPASHPKTSTR